MAAIWAVSSSVRVKSKMSRCAGRDPGPRDAGDTPELNGRGPYDYLTCAMNQTNDWDFIRDSATVEHALAGTGAC